ncbi:YqfQ family protein [Bacillus benzoevorans]|uniref:YqfQ-like protein n=1 Tax=Bacillus benzoevorans TaxID=1456 RepID=A0A7X0HSH7_9BACI|nr:YqfQ family protein [Bacillus benzoevorans]MBB6446003.1 hypothetical protein [Bacillus benzoevorans]
MLPGNPTHRPMSMHPHYPPMHPGYYRQMPVQPRFSQMNYRGPAPMRQRQGGGLLAKLLGGKQRGGAPRNLLGGMAGQNTARGPSILQSLTNPSSINGFLTNTQKVLNTAQQLGPLVQQVQQYGPLVKNLPAMWRLYRGLKNVPDAETEEETETKTKAKSQSKKQHSDANEQTEEKAFSESAAANMEESGSKWDVPGPSVPKMYI